MKRERRQQKGVTLVELMVVATIILALMTISVPMLKPMMESQVTSSAASVVSSYLNRARSRAMMTGRPCGVMFEHWNGTELEDSNDIVVRGGASLILRQVELPPVYSGMTEDACVSVCRDYDSNCSYLYLNAKSDPFSTPEEQEKPANWWIYDPYWSKFVPPRELGVNGTGYRVQFDNIGPYYDICYDGVSDRYYVEDIPGTQTPDRKRVSFKVIRGVPKPTMTAPVGLPQGTVVDMDCSGIEQAGSPENFSTQGFSSAPNVTILFSPTGEVERIIGLNTNVLPNGVPSDTIYLMIGRWDRIPAMADPDNMTPWNESTLDSYSGADDGIWNYQDGANFWVTINPRTGMVSTTELNTDIDITQPRAVQIYQSREFARQSKRNLGGH